MHFGSPCGKLTKCHNLLMVPQIDNYIERNFLKRWAVDVEMEMGRQEMGRQQYCKLNCYESRAKTVTCGIPQGSCLGPLLFIVYLNDFEKCLKASKAGMYADDTQVSLASSSVDELVRKPKMN